MIPYSPFVVSGYLLMTPILPYYNVCDRTFSFWGKKIRREYTIYHLTPLDSENFNELKYSKPDIKFPRCSTSSCWFSLVFLF